MATNDFEVKMKIDLGHLQKENVKSPPVLGSNPEHRGLCLLGKCSTTTSTSRVAGISGLCHKPWLMSQQVA